MLTLGGSAGLRLGPGLMHVGNLLLFIFVVEVVFFLALLGLRRLQAGSVGLAGSGGRGLCTRQGAAGRLRQRRLRAWPSSRRGDSA